MFITYFNQHHIVGVIYIYYNPYWYAFLICNTIVACARLREGESTLMRMVKG